MLVNLGYSVKEGMKPKKKTDDDDAADDKYILKTQIVPPVCPKCPDVTVCHKNSHGWVPQPFVNKGYNVDPTSASLTSTYEPRPMLTDFSQF